MYNVQKRTIKSVMYIKKRIAVRKIKKKKKITHMSSKKLDKNTFISISSRAMKSSNLNWATSL